MARVLAASLLAGLALTPAVAIRPPEPDLLKSLEFQHPDLWYHYVFHTLEELPASLSSQLEAELGRLGVAPEHAHFDLRTGRWGTLIVTRPLLPGSGAGNELTWAALGREAPRDAEELREATWEAFLGYLVANAGELRLDPHELAEARVSTLGDRLLQIRAGRRYRGIPVRDTYVTAAIHSGNLVLTGQRNWGDLVLDTAPTITIGQAEATLRHHLSGFDVVRFRESPRLEILPASSVTDDARMAPGTGLEYRLAWVLTPSFEGDLGTWEARVDAHSGELLAFEDTNHYVSRRIGGGIFPVSNDGTPPDGVEVPGYPMPFADVALDGTPIGFTTTGGNVAPGAKTGTIWTTLAGQFVRINDNCGAVNESVAAGDLDLGDGPGTDCAVPPGGSPGDTHSTRTTFYHLNRIIEQALGYLPANAWLQAQLPSNMNINSNCNAFWNGTVNFFTSGGGCGNTGEIAAVIAHEWGHGMDANDGFSGVSRPGEGIADIFAQNWLNDSCIGRGFFLTGNCDGFGDPCLDCSGVRDSDWAKRQSGQPHDIDWILASCSGPGNTPCGRSTHCEGTIVAEAVWDLVHRDLRGFEGSAFDLDLNTALELGTRLTYYGSHLVNWWYQCSPPAGGCNADGGYLNFLVADDDNGDLTDGTPHMSAIFAAFDRHQLTCSVPEVQDSGCTGGPLEAPANLVAAPLDEGAHLTWDPVPGASEYWIYRTEGVKGCESGKIRVGATTATEYTESGLGNGFEILYGVLAVGDGDACTGPMTPCQAVTPSFGPGGVLHGTVTDAWSSAPIEGVVIEAAGPAILGTLSGADGTFERSVPEGTYEVSAAKAGYLPATALAVEVGADDTVLVDFVLEPEPAPRAQLSPSSFDIVLPEGAGTSDVLNVGNIGTLDLHWSITTDLSPALVEGQGHEPGLDEPIEIPDFQVVSPANGGSPVTFTLPGGVLSSGQVVGFHFTGTASGISGTGTWASDTCMIVQAPDGTSYGVGGFSGTHPGCAVNPWAFQGGGSGSDGTYQSLHDDVFAEADDAGGWTFTFVNDWPGSSVAISWSDVTVTLHKVPLPFCSQTTDIPWLSLDPESGTTLPGASVPVAVQVDASGLLPGTYAADLCVETNDPTAPLVPVPVSLTVPDPCPIGASHLVLDAMTVTDTEVFEACVSITAGPGFTVASTGDVTLRAGHRVILGQGFAVASGGAFTVEIDPELLP